MQNNANSGNAVKGSATLKITWKLFYMKQEEPYRNDGETSTLS